MEVTGNRVIAQTVTQVRTVNGTYGVRFTILLSMNYIQQTMCYNHYNLHIMFHKITVSLI
jgi:hypothetical protein